MENFVTHFDINYFAKGLALFNSLKTTQMNFKLWVVSLDEETHKKIQYLNYENLISIPLKSIETNELLEVKKTRKKNEYAWTLTPFLPSAIFALDPNLRRITYVDSDIFFLNNFSKIYNEFEQSKKDVLITPHAFSPKNDISEKVGKYCVQFIIFNRKGTAGIIKNWQNQCIDWCFDRIEPERFGDQKYLDNWEQVYHNVHVLKSTHWAQGPWNATRFPYSEAIFYHFHGLHQLSSQIFIVSGYEIPKPTLRNLYKNYIDLINKNNIEFQIKNHTNSVLITLIRLIINKIINIVCFRNQVKLYLVNRFI